MDPALTVPLTSGAALLIGAAIAFYSAQFAAQRQIDAQTARDVLQRRHDAEQAELLRAHEHRKETLRIQREAISHLVAAIDGAVFRSESHYRAMHRKQAGAGDPTALEEHHNVELESLHRALAEVARWAALVPPDLRSKGHEVVTAGHAVAAALGPMMREVALQAEPHEIDFEARLQAKAAQDAHRITRLAFLEAVDAWFDAQATA